ncbi:hypothetical protein [Methylococcus geothermalis]|uniref:Uncharacterized protein n=1 Tax=Methylococcus geothermalis TaxID=2681310 RepID=A0A858QBK4_9GAMM|nr:hypothetical protein [Methylococcus geothermalis]QJD31180.1 hypothetical protein GNH96_15340 [Methylococcus geothermalis]
MFEAWIPHRRSFIYSVEADCRLNMSFEVGFTFKAAITDGGEQIDFVETDPGTALLVKAKRTCHPIHLGPDGAMPMATGVWNRRT